MKLKKIAAAVALALCAALPAKAATFNIAFDDTSTGVGSDWFGTFEAPTTGGVVSNFRALINGTTYTTDFLPFAVFVTAYNATNKTLGNLNGDTAFIIDPTTLMPGTTIDRPGLFLYANKVFRLGGCGNNCYSLATPGTYSITAAVPLPAGLPLLAGGIGLLAMLRRRKA